MAKRQKVYYPEGQIQKGLYTYGKELMSEDGIEYIGDYHTYSTGEVFTKSTYLRNVSQKLIPYINLSEATRAEKFRYDGLVKFNSNFEFASYGQSIPTQDDYNSGFVVRYFVKRHFNDLITEVTKSTYVKLSSIFYKKIELRWKLVDNASVVNERIIRNAEKDIEGISNYITDYSEFVKV
jgi:uncharacterized protein YwqG